MNNLPQTRINDVVVQDFEGEVLIYDLSINKAFCLNQTSAMIWELCDGKHSVAEIANRLSQKLDEPVTEPLIWLALDQFKRDGLLENEHFEINFTGLSRRQTIKKIGFASMVALPMIASVVAPSAANAQSGIQLLGACPTGSGCTAGLMCNSCSFGTCPSAMACCVGTGFLSPGVASLPPSSCGANGQFECDNSPSCCSGTAMFVTTGCAFPGSGGCICS